MAAIDRPPVSPQVQAQMGPPSNPAFGAGVQQAQQGIGQNSIQVAVSTIEKIAKGIQDDVFRPYAERAIAILKVGEAMASKQSPQSMPSPAAMPVGQGAPPQNAALPPMPGQMPG